MSLLGFYRMDGDAHDKALNYAYDYECKEPDWFHVFNMKPTYKTIRNEFTLNFFIRFIEGSLTPQGILIADIDNLRLYLNDKYELAIRFKDVDGELILVNNLPINATAYETLFFSISKKYNVVKILTTSNVVNDTMSDKIEIIIPEEYDCSIETFKIHNDSAESYCISVFDEIISDRTVLELYKNKVMSYSFENNLNRRDGQRNLIRNGNFELEDEHWVFTNSIYNGKEVITHTDSILHEFTKLTPIDTNIESNLTVGYTPLSIEGYTTYYLSYTKYDMTNKKFIKVKEELTTEQFISLSIILNQTEPTYIKDIMISVIGFIPYRIYEDRFESYGNLLYKPDEERIEYTIQPDYLKISEPELLFDSPMYHSSEELPDNILIWNNDGKYNNGSLKLHDSNVTISFNDTLTNVEDDKLVIVKMCFKIQETIQNGGIKSYSSLLKFGSCTLNAGWDVNKPYVSFINNETGVIIGEKIYGQPDNWFDIIVSKFNDINGDTHEILTVNGTRIVEHINPSNIQDLSNIGYGAIGVYVLLDSFSVYTTVIPEVISDNQSLEYLDRLFNENIFNNSIKDIRILEIDDMSIMWGKRIEEFKKLNQSFAIDNTNQIANTTMIRNVGRLLRYFRVLCDGSINTNDVHVLDITKVECYTNNVLVKSFEGRYSTMSEPPIEVVFDLEEIMTIDLIKVWLNPIMFGTVYTNKRLQISTELDKWEDIYLPYDAKHVDERYNTSTDFLLIPTSFMVDGTNNVIISKGDYNS